MARWRVCDDHWYWFMPFRGDDGEEYNLWPCRHCGAMVMGIKKGHHERFHIKTDTCYPDTFNPDEGIVT